MVTFIFLKCSFLLYICKPKNKNLKADMVIKFPVHVHQANGKKFPPIELPKLTCYLRYLTELVMCNCLNLQRPEVYLTGS